MNYHLLIDHWFTKAFVPIAEAASPGNNRYVLTFDNPGKYFKGEIGIFAPYGSADLDRIVSEIGENDSLYIHWFHNPVMYVVRKLPARTSVFLCFWGGDMIQTSTFERFNFDPLTKQYLKAKTSKNSRESWMRMLRRTVRNLILPPPDVELRRELLARINYFCHWNEIDLQQVREAYGGNPEFINFFYEAGIDKIPFVAAPVVRSNSTAVIWLGNSDTETNNHLDAIDQLGKYEADAFQIVCPLSYGNKEYGDVVDDAGKRKFGQKWNSLRDFMPLEEYTKMQLQADVIVMYHNRTQAGFNIFGFLRMGKKVFLKKQSTICQFLESKGVILGDAAEIGKMPFEEFIRPLSASIALSNSNIIASLFSEDVKIKNYTQLLAPRRTK